MTGTDAEIQGRWPQWLRRCGGAKASVAGVTLVGLSLVAGLLIEAARGADVARWHVYDSTWFLTILVACALHAVCAAVTRIPCRRDDLAALFAYLAVAVLIGGQVTSHLGGISGELVLAEGESARHFVRPDRTRISAARQDQPDEPPYEFAFDGGPANWTEGRSLDLGEVDGIGARVLHYYAQAWPVVEWIDSTPATGGPSVRLNMCGPKGERISEPQLIDDGLGEELFVGPLRIQLYRSSGAGMLEDFRNPPARSIESLGENGQLIAFHGDSAIRISVRENVGRRVPLGAGGLEVELVAYLPNARPDRLGKFSSVGDEPKNPVVELRVHGTPRDGSPRDGEPLRQLAFAKSPLLNLDPVNGRPCPVKFRYYHPAIDPVPGLELIQDGAGQLHARVASGGAYRVLGAVSGGQTWEVSSGFTATLAEHRPHVTRRVTWRPVEPASSINGTTDARSAPNAYAGVGNGPLGTGGPSPMPQPAIEVEFRSEGTVRTAWFKRGQPGLDQALVDMPHGPLAIVCEPERVPLGFTVELAGVQTRTETSDHAPESSSQLKTVDADGRSHPPRTVACNQPFTNGPYTFYQLETHDVGHGKRTARFHIAANPGRPFQYLGGLLAVVSACAGLVPRRRANEPASAAPPVNSQDSAPDLRAILPFQPRAAEGCQDEAERTEPEQDSEQDSERIKPRRSRWSAAAALLTCLTLGSPATSWAADADAALADADPGRFDWTNWRQLPVLDAGRAKPLDTMAREFLHATSGCEAGRDPTSHAKLEPIAATMALVFEWRGWEHPSIERLLLVKDARSEYFHFHEPDRWDRAAILRVDSPLLGEALGLDAADRFVAPAALAKLRMEDASGEGRRPLPFPAWALVVGERAKSGMALTELERAGLALAERLWTYQDLRMGRSVRLLPKGPGTWMTLDELVLTPFDPATDPTGEKREAQQRFWDARRAYRDGDMALFATAASEFLRAARQDASQSPEYPSARRVAWEVAARRWSLIRLAWGLLAMTVVAAIVAAVAGKTGRPGWMRIGRACAATCYVGGTLAALIVVGVRFFVAGRPPLTNTYEVLIVTGTIVVMLGAIVGAIFARTQRAAGVRLAAALIGLLAFALADLGGGTFDATIRPTTTLLRSTGWLSVHVATITIGYAALALAWGLAMIELARSFLGGGERHEASEGNGRLIEQSIRVGVGFLVAGMVSGCFWADLAWGRFWGWDPKEVWTLVGLLAYVGLLVVRQQGWLGERGWSWAASGCFLVLVLGACVVHASYPAGLHVFEVASPG